MKTDIVNTHNTSSRGAPTADLFHSYSIGQVVKPSSSVFFWDIYSHQAELSHLTNLFGRKCVISVILSSYRHKLIVCKIPARFTQQLVSFWQIYET